MAGYRGHLAFSTALGFAYGGMAHRRLDFDIPSAVVATGLTALAGLLPDLDSDASVPNRETCALAGILVPLLVVPPLGLPFEHAVLWMAGGYLGIRYGLSQVLRRLTVHRGMFHSLPAMCIAGMIAFLCVRHPDARFRLLLAGSVMIGYLSHLLLDEMSSVDFNGLRVVLKSSSGTAVKCLSRNWMANVVCYAILAALAFGSVREWERIAP